MQRLLRNRHFWLLTFACAISLVFLVSQGQSLEEATASIVVLGVLLPLLAFLACWRMPDPPRPQPWRQDDGSTLAILLGWIVVFLLVKGPLLEALTPAGAGAAFRFTVNAALKLAAFVALPAALLRGRGFGWRQAGHPIASTRRLLVVFLVVGIICVGVQCLMGREFQRLLAGDYPHRHIVVAGVLAFVWMTVEAGLVEEFFFRWYLQSRLAAWSGSEVSAVTLSSLIFGLAHAPGIWLRGGGVVEGLGSSPSLAATIAYVIVTQGVAGLMFGVLWSRTRSFALVVMLHGLVDLPANLAVFMDTWGL